MEYQERKSGLVVPVQKAKPKRVIRGVEICDEEQRAEVRDALLSLWDAMRISNGGRFDGEGYDVRYRAYRYIGEMLLGADCPEKEIYT